MELQPNVALIPVSLDHVSGKVGAVVSSDLLAVMPEIIRRARLGEYLTEEQAQAETGLSKRQLRYLRNQRRIPYQKMGKRTVLYKTIDLFEAIDAGTVPARDPIAK